ncbi:MAG: type II/IV secretion system protein [Candidatus Pacebacteria bacterium]|nr:type II/IV secretion system protein [Candidatus Paceibacterota bacterium]MBP9842958.1 type II/IV secretion system protein [Candidatus Paceibacterota bacterium]
MVQFDNTFSGSRINDIRAQEEERYVQTMAPRHGLEYIYLRGYTINPEALQIIPEADARQLNIVAFDIKQNLVSIAVKNPDDPRIKVVLEMLATKRYTTKLFMCSVQSLEHAWNRYKDLINSSTEKKGVLEISPEDIMRMRGAIKAKEDVPKLLAEISTTNNVRRISATLELVFAGALALRASDIHIEPEEHGIRLRYRFDGVLHDIVDIDRYIYERMISRLKLLSGMTLNARKIAQDGRFTFDTGDREIEIRSSIIPGAIGESIVMRILDPSVASFSMENLQLNPYIKAAIINEIKKPNGLIVTTGPTGSGKTTALYAFLREAHNEGVKIITIENPVEYKIEGIVQTQIGDDYTFAAGLRAVLRQDPDIIMIGEVRDLEVAETAIHAAQTGHLVFTTLHTNSAAAGFPRLMDMGIDPRSFGTSINIMLGQRLIRVLCEACKQGYQASATEHAIIAEALKQHPYPPHVPANLTIYKPVGCSACGDTGYKGRAGIFEGIIMDEAVEEAVLRDPREHVILEAARPQKIPSMLEDGVEKIIQGITSFSELERVVELPHGVVSSNPITTPTPTTPTDDDFLSHIV